jgi:HD-GYP domain-containing protein (c-di-GMP phosphodiesterase class II)
LWTLHEIDQAILTNFDLPKVLEICLGHVIMVLGVDGADVVLKNAEEIGALPFHGVGIASRVDQENGAAARGLRLQRIVRDQEQVFIPNIGNPSDETGLSAFIFKGGFFGYCGLPLIAKGRVEGILELYSLSPLDPPEDWFDFLETISSQIALAVEDMHYYAGMRQSLESLEKAYDKTIEGWSKAMDLRDRETEGHTQRVTHITLQLARQFGFKEEDLRTIRWGAQLHDMGKLGIPDKILFKPGKLSPIEWDIMRQHPQLAYDMLQSIDYLKPALDIPYCHHEKWDGSGYPNGLKGREIPLSARIFAVADVWDALSSNRPYRPRWPEDRVMNYIQDQAGQHFDPAVVEAFMEYLSAEPQDRG